MTDRAAFSEGATIRRLPLEEALPRYRRFLDEIEAQLGDGRTYVFGGDWTIADFSIYHMLWFIHAGGGLPALLEAHPAAKAWFDRIRRLGATRGEDLSPDEALGIAAEAEPSAVEPASDLGDTPVGALVDVAPTDYGVMPTRGELLRCDDAVIVISREHERTGAVNVHFPRHGFAVTRV
jgi:glutathione S-transferase